MSQTKYRQATSASADKHRDLIPRTGVGGGAALVEGASKFLQGYGKILGPLVLLIIGGILIYSKLKSLNQIVRERTGSD